MNESPRRATPDVGIHGSADRDSFHAYPPHPTRSAFPGQSPATSAGPLRAGGEAAQTRPMPIVSDVPGGEDDRGNGDGRGPRPEPRQPGRPPGAGGSHPHDGWGVDASRRAPGERRRSRADGGDSTDRGTPPDSGPGQGPQPAGRSTRPTQPDTDGGPRVKKRAGRDLRAAIGVGLSLGVVILLSLFVYKPVFLGVIVIAVVVGAWELTTRLSERKGIRAPLVPLAVGGAAMVTAGYVWGAEGAWTGTALTLLAVLAWRMTSPPEEYLRDVSAAVFAVAYVPFLATFVALMLAADDGPWRVFTFLLLTVVSDTGAYAIGWRFGRRKLAPRISPGKTREGLLGAVAFAMVAGALSLHFLIEDGRWWQGLLLGLAVAVSATLGDLGESMIKRDLDIKDMGTLLPGHGGIMDRLDSLLPTAPVVWLLLVVFVGSG